MEGGKLLIGHLLIIATSVCLIKATGDFTGFKLFQARPETDRHKELLNQMDENLPEDLVDFWFVLFF